MLDNEHDLVELLQAPELMEQCVKNSLYEEALDLHDYIKSMCQRHPDIPILVSLVLLRSFLIVLAVNVRTIPFICFLSSM